MLIRKLAIPAAVIFLLGSGASLRPANPVHAAAPSANYSGTVAITDWQFPVATGMGGTTTASAADAEIASAMFDGLLGTNQTGNFYADMATEIPSTSNGGIKVVGGNEVVTFHLKPNMKWSDGQPITTDDQIAGLLFDFAPEVNDTDPLNRIKTITFSGSDMTINYDGIYAPALQQGLPGVPNVVGPIPVHYFESKYGGTIPTDLLGSYDRDKVEAYFKASAYKGSSFQKLINAWLNDAYISPKDVFSGPYMLGEWTADQRITLLPNPYYNILPPDPNHPRVAKIQFVEVSTSETNLAQALTASSTYASIDKAEDFQLTDLAALYKSKYQVLTPPALFYEHLEFNEGSPGNPALRDSRVRQALYYALNKQAYIHALFPSVKDWKTVALASILPSVSPWSINSQLPANAYDPAKAKALLAAAGYANAPGGSGKHLTLDFVTTNAGARIRSAQLLQLLWGQVGINIRIRYVAAYGTNGNGLFDSYQDGGILARHTFDIAEFAFQTLVDPDESVLNLEPSQIGSATTPAGVNYQQIRDPKLVNYFLQARVTLDQAKRMALYAAMQKYIVDQAYQISLYNRPAIATYKGTIGNFKPNATQAGYEWNAYQWWFDASASQKPLTS